MNDSTASGADPGNVPQSEGPPQDQNLPETLPTARQARIRKLRDSSMRPIIAVSKPLYVWLIGNWTAILVGVVGGLLATLPFKWMDDRNAEKVRGALLTVVSDIERQIRTADVQGGLRRIEQLEAQLPESLDPVLYGRLEEVKAEALLRWSDVGDQEESQVDAALVALSGAERAARADPKIVMPGRILWLRCQALSRKSQIRRAMHFAKDALRTCNLAVDTLATDPKSYDSLRARIERANVLRILGELSDQGDYLEQGEKELKSVLAQADAINDPELQYLSRNTLGPIYIRQVQHGRIDDANKAISILREALQFAPLEERPLQWARVQLNLCSAYQIQPLRFDKKRLLTAVAACEESLKVFRSETYPRMHASVRTGLSGIYSGLAVIDDASQNFHRAISEAEAAIAIITPEKHPIEYARAHHTLGYAHVGLADLGEDSSAHARLAVRALRQALSGRMRASYPYDYFLSRINLACAYALLTEPEDDPVSNLRQAIVILNEEISNAKATGRELDVARCNHPLGEAYSKLIRYQNPSENLNRALAALDITYRYYARNANPFLAGQMEMLKADALMNFGETTGNLQALSRARNALDLASRYINSKDAPAQYEALTKSKKRLTELVAKMGHSGPE